MKNPLVAGLLLAALTPVAAHSAPIVWDSESYTISSQLQVDDLLAPVYSETKSSPFTYANTISTVNGTASTNISIKNLSNSNESIFELTNYTATSYNGGRLDAFVAGTSAGLFNTFVAQTTNLYVTYDASSLINMAASSSGLSYQEVTTSLSGNVSGFSTIPIDDYVDNGLSQSGIQPPHNATTTGINYLLAKSGTYVFSNLLIGQTYSIGLNISPDMVSSGTIADNSSNNFLRVSFSDSVTAVPEPETYAMLLAGLALVGFSARRKQQS